MQDEIRPYLTARLQETAYNLTVTGHSMVRLAEKCSTFLTSPNSKKPLKQGASGASIFATALRAQGLSLNAYTYGQPRTGNKAFANYVDSMFPFISESQETNKMLRVTHANDGIAQVPSRKLKYRHHSTEIWIPPTENGVYRCIGQEPKDCNARFLGYPLNSPHFSYLGVSTGNPLYRSAACKGHRGPVDSEHWRGSEDLNWEEVNS